MTYSQHQTVFSVHKSCCQNNAATGVHSHAQLTPKTTEGQQIVSQDLFHKSCCQNTAETGVHIHTLLNPSSRLFSSFTRAVVKILLKLVFTFIPYLIQAVDCFQRSQNAVVKILLNSKFMLTTAQQNSQELLSKYCSTRVDIHSTLQASLSITLPPNLSLIHI